MGLFGPSKKGGGLDMRFKSNKGGMTGKIVGGIMSSMMSSSSDYDFEKEEKKEKELERQSFYDKKDDNLVNMDIPENEKELIDFMDYLVSIIGLHGWHMSQQDEPQRKNALSDAALSKFEMGLFKLMQLSSAYHPFYEKKFKAFKRKRFIKKYVTWMIALFFFILLFMFGMSLE
jgi:hypothetical protein